MYTIKDGKEKLKEGYTFVSFGAGVHLSKERGIKPIVTLLKADADALKDALVCDRVIGKAAALLLVYGGIQNLYTPVISRPAAEILERYGVPFVYDSMAERIKNRTGDGLCPMETLAMEINTPDEAFQIFSNKL